MALSSIATEQAKPTAKTLAIVKQLLDYCATQEEAIVTFKASNMILQVHSNAGYANEKNHAATHEEILTSPAIINPPQQWCNFNNRNNNQIDHVVGSRSKTC